MKTIQIYDWYGLTETLEELGLRHLQELKYSEERVIRIVRKFLSLNINVMVLHGEQGVYICISKKRFGQS